MVGEEEAVVTVEVDGPEPVTEEGSEAIPRVPKGAGTGRSGPNLKLVAVAAVIILLSVVVWQVWFTGGDRSEWAYEMTQANAANDAGYTGKDVRVAVVDTGINADHPAFKGVDLVAWKDLVNGRSEPYDDQGHGTAMASIIAGQSKLPGGAPDVELMVVKVLDSEGASSDSRVADGIDWCVDPNDDGDYSDGADVISLSLGGRTSYVGILIGTESQAAIHRAADLGVYCIAAAGNDGENDDGDVSSPGWFTDVICVGAVDEDGKMAPFSSRGRNIFKQDPNKKPEVVAPGVDIVSADHLGGYRIGSGTSQATAFMTACVALVLDAHPELARGGSQGGNEDVIYHVKWAILRTSKKLDGQDLPHDNWAGYGMVQVMDLIEDLA